MKLRIIKVGKPAYPEYLTLVGRLQERLRRFVKFEERTFKSSQNREKDSIEILNLIAKAKREFFVVCDERGEDLTSVQLAEKLKTWEENPASARVTFLIGGPYGFSDEVRNAASLTWRLSHGVLPSDLAWLVCTEQIYRAYCINHNINYHHE